MDGAALVPRRRRHLVQRLPEAERPVAGRQLRRDGQAARLEIDQQPRGATGSSSSAGRSENRSETKRALIRPEELLQGTRADEAVILSPGNPPLRCGRAIYFRRPEWNGLVGANRFHRPDAAG